MSWQKDNNITGPPRNNSKGPMKSKGKHNKEPISYNKKAFNKSAKKSDAADKKE